MQHITVEEKSNNKFDVNGEEIYAPNLNTALKRAGISDAEAALFMGGYDDMSPSQTAKLVNSTKLKQDKTIVNKDSKTMKLFRLLMNQKEIGPLDARACGIYNIRGAVRSMRAHGHNVKMKRFISNDDFLVVSDLSESSREKYRELIAE